ncbi:hypothetical protein EDD16DRAFT_1692885 [Pisolithus croceorrhizus]|nr:hypothetical protein EDD16DRAFT_1692885 [Pisolithus croceorrhizus]
MHAQFGHATAWPVYLFFGNLSKYEHASASPGTCHPVAFIPSLPESLTNFINSFMKRKNHLDLLVHCKHDLFHAVWKTLLDDKFIEVYGNGIVIRCHDGVLCHMNPQIFMYSADYPEKIIIVAIHDKGLCPCPRCCLPKSSFSHLGFMSDCTGQLTCLNKNSFAEHLSLFHFNIYLTLIVDLMHEFELGILKFFAIPPFGVDRICCFLPNVAEMRQQVSRHFKDMLQSQSKSEFPNNPALLSACLKSFNILTYKFHVLGDYTRSI